MTLCSICKYIITCYNLFTKHLQWLISCIVTKILSFPMQVLWTHSLPVALEEIPKTLFGTAELWMMMESPCIMCARIPPNQWYLISSIPVKLHGRQSFTSTPLCQVLRTLVPSSIHGWNNIISRSPPNWEYFFSESVEELWKNMLETLICWQALNKRFCIGVHLP